MLSANSGKLANPPFARNSSRESGSRGSRKAYAERLGILTRDSRKAYAERLGILTRDSRKAYAERLGDPHTGSRQILYRFPGGSISIY